MFADVDPHTLNLDPAAVERRSRSEQAIVASTCSVTLRARRAAGDRRPARAGAHRRLCEALGAEYKGPRSARTASPPVFGFYPNKQITTGEGGVVTTHSEEERDLLVSLRNQGRSYENRWFHHVRLGFNYRFTDLQAAVGIAQLESWTGFSRCGVESGELHGRTRRDRRRRGAARGRLGSPALLVRHAAGLGRWDRPRRGDRAPGADGVEAGLYVPCVHLQPYMRERYGFAEGVCPVAEDAAARSRCRSSPGSSRGSGTRRRSAPRCALIERPPVAKLDEVHVVDPTGAHGDRGPARS